MCEGIKSMERKIELRNADCGMRNADFGFEKTNDGGRISEVRRQMTEDRIEDCGFRNSDCGMGIAEWGSRN